MKPKQFFFIVLGLMGLLLAVSAGGYYYALTRIHTQSEDVSNKLAEQAANDNQIDSLISLQHQYSRDIVPILPLIDAALPRDKKQTEILAQIQRIAGNNGLFVASVSMPSPLGLPSGVSQTIKAGLVLALPINFQVSGSYNQLQSFTSSLENLNRFTNITTLAISHEDKSKPIVYSISLNAYIKP